MAEPVGSYRVPRPPLLPKPVPYDPGLSGCLASFQDLVEKTPLRADTIPGESRSLCDGNTQYGVADRQAASNLAQQDYSRSRSSD